MNVETGMMSYALAPKKFARVKHFFDEAAYRSFQNAVDALQLELGRVTDFLPAWPDINPQDIFRDVVRSRESSILFSNVRVLQSTGEIESVTQDLFGRYVKRELYPENAEARLTKVIRRELIREGIRGFKNIKIHDDLIPISFPLAIQDHHLRANKPLAFSQKSPMSIVDYGAHWRKRLSYLLDKKAIREENVIIAAEAPSLDSEDPIHEAYFLAKEDLRQLPFEIVDGQVGGQINSKIFEFARNSAGYNRRLWR